MGGADGRKADLFDTSSRSGQTDLFDTRKRKAAAMASPHRGGFDCYEPHTRPPPQQKHYYPPSLDLGAMLYPDRISVEKFRNIQGTFKDQDRKIQSLIKDANAREQTLIDRGQEIKTRCSQISSLNKQVDSLERQNKRLAAEKERQEKAAETTLKQAREKREKLQSLVKEKDDFLAIGTTAVKETTELAKRVESENTLLRSTITERDGMISKLNEQIWRVTSATGDEQTHARLEAQAQATLGMMNGLRKDVEVRDARVKDLEGQVEKMNSVIKGGNQAMTELQREVETVKRELKKEREVAESATKQAREARGVADEQKGLIGKILEENKRLVRAL